MNRAFELGLGCLLLALVFGGGCGDDDDEVVFSDASAISGERDAAAEPNDDEGQGEPGGDGDGDGDGDGESSGGEDSPSDAATNEGGEGAVDGGGSSEAADAGAGTDSGDAATAQDAAVAPATDCESLQPCCDLLRGAPRNACLAALEAADDEACAEIGQRACMVGDGGRPTPEMCDEVAPCCAALEQGRRKTACEAAASGPVGRACERAVQMYCEQ